MNNFEHVWRQIAHHAGAEFKTKSGNPFTYTCSTGAVHLQNTNRSIPRRDFVKALERFPVSGPGELQDLQGPSYLYAILHDSRVQ